MSCRSKYRIFPALTPEERASLKVSIAANGVEVPAITDEEGNIIDGHHRDVGPELARLESTILEARK